MRPLHEEFNDFLADLTGASINYVAILMGVIALPLIYSAYLVIHNSIRIGKTQETKPHLANKIIAPIVFALFIFLFYYLISTFGEEAFLIKNMLAHYSLYLYLFMIVCIIIFLYPLSTQIVKLLKKTTSKLPNPKVEKTLVLGSIIIVYLFLFAVPMIFQPVYALSGDLPAKPEIIAHRGGQHYAPENTVIAAVYANQIGAYGMEIDVQLSVDGVPFLLHDETLERTTDVEELFSGREDDAADSFNIAELTSLNAGEWFTTTDPYGTIGEGKVPSALIDDYELAMLPTLEEFLDYVNDTDLILSVELKRISDDHPLIDQFSDIVIDVLIEADMDDQIWVQSSNEDILDDVEYLAPGMTSMLSLEDEPLTPEEFLTKGFDMINTHYSLSNKIFRGYVEAGIEVNIYTVDLKLSFQQAWALGISYVTTNEPIVFIDMSQPTWYLSKGLYLGIWIIIDVVGITIVLVLKYIKTKKNA
jgi:glycerophosphoryl diester phosphodiesterase